MPAQIIKIGARAVLGKALRTTKNGLITSTILSKYQSKLAINIPMKLPIIIPNNVSNNEKIRNFIENKDKIVK